MAVPGSGRIPDKRKNGPATPGRSLNPNKVTVAFLTGNCQTHSLFALFLPSVVGNFLKPLGADFRRYEVRTKRCLWTTQQISHLNDTNASEIFRAA